MTNRQQPLLRVYGDMYFEGELPRPVRELAPGHVIYANSLSKVVGGGLRSGGH